MYSTGGVIMETERKYIKIVLASLILEFLLYLFVKFNDSLSELYLRTDFNGF